MLSIFATRETSGKKISLSRAGKDVTPPKGILLVVGVGKLLALTTSVMKGRGLQEATGDYRSRRYHGRCVNFNFQHPSKQYKRYGETVDC